MAEGRNQGARNGHARLSQADVVSIRARLAAGESGRSVAAAFAVHPSLVCLIKSGKRWSTLGGAA